jgi:hypothetical protein
MLAPPYPSPLDSAVWHQAIPLVDGHKAKRRFQLTCVKVVAVEVGLLLQNLSPTFGLRKILYIIHALDIHGCKTTTEAYIGYEICFVLQINQMT